MLDMAAAGSDRSDEAAAAAGCQPPPPACDATTPVGRFATEGDYVQPALSYTIDEAIDGMGMGRFNAAILCMGGVAWMADAAEVLLISFIKPAVQCEWGVSDLEGSLISSAVGLGMLVGAILWGLVADRYGRRYGFLATGVFTFLFGLLSAGAPSYMSLVVARFLCGLGLGGVPVVFSLAMEFLPSDQRGKWGIGFLLFWSVGGMLEAALAYEIMIEWGWRWQVGLTAVPAGLMVRERCMHPDDETPRTVCAPSRWGALPLHGADHSLSIPVCMLQLLIFPILPESPRWLFAQGRRDEADAVLRQMARWNGVGPLAGSLRADDGAGAMSDGLEVHNRRCQTLYGIWIMEYGTGALFTIAAANCQLLSVCSASV